VWKGIHKKTKEVRAVKKVPIEDNIEDLLKEIQHMKELNSPYIVGYYGSYLTDNILWVKYNNACEFLSLRVCRVACQR
jgi:serine/threonine protein kinase